MRRRILLLVTGITVLVVLAFAIPVAFLVRSTVEQRSERSIRDEAAAIAHFLNAGTTSTVIPVTSSKIRRRMVTPARSSLCLRGY